jgi:hypothetical protein
VTVRDFIRRVFLTAHAFEPVLPEIIDREIVDPQNENEGGYCLIYALSRTNYTCCKCQL